VPELVVPVEFVVLRIAEVVVSQKFPAPCLGWHIYELPGVRGFFGGYLVDFLELEA